MTTYQDIGKLIQLNGKFANVKTGQLQVIRGDNYNKTYIPRDDAIALFNSTAEKVGLQPVKDPKGYMVLDHNLQSTAKQMYEERYVRAYNDIEDGVGYGTTYAMGYILDNLDKVVRKDLTGSLPKGVLYSELRFTPTTPEMKHLLNDFIDARMEVTITKSISRQFEQGAVERSVQKFQLQQERFKNQISIEMGLNQEQGFQQ